MSTTTRIAIAELDRLIAAGYFDTPAGTERTELVDGELLPMSPIGPIHDWLVDYLNRWSCDHIAKEAAAVRIQSCLEIRNRGSVLQPDVLWISPGDYRKRRPTSADALLVIEVADSSLAYDRERKAGLYAAGEVPEYWIVNISDRSVEVLQDPDAGRYKTQRIYTVADTVSPQAFPQVFLAVADLFPDEA
jgi:Uma2 family endonuclease